VDESNWKPAKWDGSVASTGSFDDLNDATNSVTWAQSSFGNFSVASDIPLPIELVDFVGYREGYSHVLQWITATELNNDYFELQRSKDGVEFSLLGRIEGAGTTNQRSEYEFVDENPYAAKNYYRLKQVDFDGRSTYSKTILLNAAEPEPFSAKATPNPATSDDLAVVIRGAKEDEMIQVVVADLSGKIVLRSEVRASGLVNTVQLKAQALAVGNYIITVTQGFKTANSRLIVVK
jgi:hypothetical protein